MTKTPPTIGLVGKYRSDEALATIRSVLDWLKLHGFPTVVETETASLIAIEGQSTRDLVPLGDAIDLAIVVGGDGTMLHAARALAPFDVPLIGVNEGRVGFLADIEPDHMFEHLKRMLEGDAIREERLLLSAEIMRKGRIVHEAIALNDVIISKGDLARMIDFETYIGGEFVHEIRGDGIIIATPTGSTAYALSAGGPILHPSVPAIILAPVCPHTLTNRPLVVSGDSVIEILIAGGVGQHAHATFDGQSHAALEDGDRLYVRRHAHPVVLLHPPGHSYYETLRIKLHWGQKL